MHLVFWQNILSPHQAPFLRSLASSGHEVTIVTHEAMTEDRRALGWDVPDLGRARIIVAPGVPEVRQLVASTPPETIHVMAGARLTALGPQALRQCIASRRRVGVLSEAPDRRGLMGWGRWAKYTLERYARGSRYDFLLVMGEIGLKWFHSCSYPKRKLFPFAYVAESIRSPDAQRPAGTPVMLYAGRFIALKGLDILLRAFAAVAFGSVQLRLLGDGPEKERLRALARELGIEKRLAWLPHRNRSGVRLEMGKADVTLLPSHKDGWGAVVNESLMTGTPVICSTACGASELIRQPWLGTVFRAGCAEDLAKALQHWADLGRRSPVERERIRRWSACITGESLAKYFTAVMDHVYANSPRPDAPWRV
jgi:glycosyltransferase involved in cell wall biosynthesis